MPTYQYACTACDHRFDTVQSFSDASLTDCPTCPGALRKVFSSVGIVFKGSGFYRTDSRAGAGSTVAKGEPSSSPKGKESSGSGQEGSTSKEGSRSGAGKGSQSKESATASSSSSSGSAGAPAAAAS